MRKAKENIRQIYNKILSRLEQNLTNDLNKSLKDEYDLVMDEVEQIFHHMLVSRKISGLVLSNFEILYNGILDYTIKAAIEKLTYASIDEPDPRRYNVRFYQRLITQFDERVQILEYSSLGEVLRQILIDEDVLDEISYIIYFMPQWFKDMMKCKIKLDDQRDDQLNPDATVEISSTEEFDGY